MTDLDRLIEAVDAGLAEPSHFNAVFNKNSAHWVNGKNAELADDGSLDAALALHGALLGEAHWSIAEDDDYGFCGKVYLREWFHEHSHVAARAWLLAILKAYRSLQ